jgi:hypothetical protein
MKLSIGIYMAFSFALYCWHIATFVLGAFLAEYFDVSDTGFYLKSDIKKAAICSFVALTPILFIYYHAPSGKVLIIYLLLLSIPTKLAYLGTNHGALAIIMGTNLVGLMAFPIVFRVLKLWGILTLAFLAITILLVKYTKQKKLEKHLVLKEKHNEQKIRNMARLHPDFYTLCNECKHYNQGINDCQKKRDQRLVKNIQINGKTCCASWESINS